MTVFIATAGGPDDEADHPLGSSPSEDHDSPEVEPPHKEDEGLYIPSYLEEAIPDDPVLQVKVVMEVIKESEISKLAILWSSSRISWLMWDVTAKLGQVVVNDVANKPIASLNVNEIVRVASKCTVPPFGHKVIHGRVNLVLCGCKLNVNLT